jgi:tetratricopeptide (TPR) repeat protein
MEMAKYLEHHKACHPRPYTKTAECYFETAITFAEKYNLHDGNTRNVYGVYLHKRGELDAALKQYKQAENLLPNSAEVHYNLGLLYVDKKDFKNAQFHAEKAYRLGHPLPGLRNKLIAAGVWTKNAGR